MRNDLLIIGVAVLASFFGLEWALDRRKKTAHYQFEETLANLGQGVGQLASNAFVIPFLIYLYDQVFEHCHLLTIESHSVVAWISLILLIDLAFYTAHRAGHRVNIFIAAHAVHHQSHTFNLGSAFRQSWTGRVGMFPFFLALPVIGFPTPMFATAQVLIMLAQFFSHAGVVQRRFGWLEHVFVTPMNHRVHHGIDGYYIDKNFGGIFIFWDILFKSYRSFSAEHPIAFPAANNDAVYAPVAANLDYFRRIAAVARRRPTFSGKCRIWLQSPETLESELPSLPESNVEQRLRPLTGSGRAQVLAMFGVSAAATIWMTYRFNELPKYVSLAVAVGAIFVLAAMGTTLRKRFRDTADHV